MEGNWRSGQEYRFVLLTTDGIRWRRYAPDWSEVEFGKLTFGRNFKLKETRRFDLSADTLEEFPFFLDEILFTSQPKQATLENIQNDFGDTSSVFINSMAHLHQCADDIKTQSELQVAFDQWRRFLSVAYGKFDDSPTMFLVHTYLSVFAKCIAFAVLTKKPINDEATIIGILNGSIFEKLNIDRFVEDDFFHWVAAENYFKTLRPMFREMNWQLHQYDFTEVREDILKGVYQELIDLETRHALGEYYTPDWLCERVVDELELTAKSSVLDPACGSGSFLRAAISRLRDRFPKLGAAELAEQVVGIDIHPLSVLIAKTTVLLTLGPSIAKAKRPVTLHIYLANSLLVPRGTADLFRSTFQIAVDNKNYVLDVQGLNGGDDFDRLIGFCDEMVERYAETLERSKFTRLLQSEVSESFSRDLPEQLYEIYRGMKIARDEGRDSIWKFVLQNSYKPVFLMNRFDFVVGNPPWLTYASVSNGEYQGLLRQLSDSYGVTPLARANMPHLEIAAIFLAHSVNYFLKPSGKLAFVMPRSVMSADQHDNTRSGLTLGVKLTQVWDLNEVTPLFRVPCCVVMAIRTSDAEQSARQIPPAGIPGLAFSGRLPKSQIHWGEASKKLTEESRRWYLSRLQGGRGAARSALTAQAMDGLVGKNAYASRFTQGATIVPRNFYFVDLEAGDDADDIRDRVVAVRTADATNREAKKPWKGQLLSGRAEGALLFRTAISRNVIPFAMIDPLLVLLPLIEVESADKKLEFKVLDAEKLREHGHRYSSAWFFEAEKHWERLRTDVNREQKVSLSSYLNWQQKLTEQNPEARFLVLYTSSATDASAAVIDRSKFDHPFVVDHKTYWCECNTEAEGHYISAYINSGFANSKIKEFQSRGLFGPRDIHKLIVKLPFPKFQKGNPDHDALSLLGKQCADEALAFTQGVSLGELHPRALGTARTQLKQRLSRQLGEIDAIVETLSTGVSDEVSGTSRARRAVKTGKLI